MTRRHLLQTSLLAASATTLPPLISQTAAQSPAVTEIFKLPPLPYPADALEPHIDAQTMTIHHDKHHQAYVTGLNTAVAKLPEKPKGSWEELEGWLSALDKVPEEIRTAVRNHGGGHYNHSLFWTGLSPKGGSPKGALLKAIEDAFKTTDALFTELQDKGLKQFGSGWVWLVYNPKTKLLAVTTTANQDTPLASGHKPLLGIDVWEHAYYLKYQNKRADYLKAAMSVLNWDAAAERYEQALKA